MGRIKTDVALESWLFGFRPCSGQGQFTLVSGQVWLTGTEIWSVFSFHGSGAEMQNLGRMHLENGLAPQDRA